MPMQGRDADPWDLRGSIIERIEAQIQQRLGGRVTDLQVAIRDGGLVLRGRTRTHHAKQVALQTVLDITDLPIRSNDIRAETDPRPAEPWTVTSSTGPHRDGLAPEESRGVISKPERKAGASLFARMIAIRSDVRTPSQ